MAINYQRASDLLLETQHAMQCDEGERTAQLRGQVAGCACRDCSMGLALQRHALGVGCGSCLPRDWVQCCMDASIRSLLVGVRGARSAISESLVSYFADNAATRISSCRDKLALLAWAYYCPFNPDKKDEVLNFDEVRGRFTNPLRFGLRLTGHDEFLAELNKLVGFRL